MYQAKFNLVFDNLPPRQKEVLLKLLAGEGDQAIAKSLNIEKSTVRKHIEKIHKAFALNNDFSDERRSKRLDLLLLFAQYKPELLGEGSLQSEERSQSAESPQLPQLDSSNATRDNNPDSARREETADYAPEDLDVLVQRVRSRCHDLIQEQCGKMRVLDMSQRIGLSHLYTSVNILEKIPSRQWREIDELLEERNPANFYRFGLSRVTEARVSGLEAVKRYLKLMILGKPGSGKTTFLKYLAIQCNAGVFQGDRVPIFITLKKFAEAEEQPSLLEYITQFFSDCDVAAEQAALLLKHGRALILLDGLDEVKEEDDRRISKQVRDFSEKFRTNQFVITCRIAARKYIFDKFTEVEVADFDGRQIATFVEKWFQDKEPAKAERLIQQLRENEPILELATSPLLLTLLCLVFEESAKFPTNRSELYEEGIDILLKRWDETREIERTQIYKNLSVQRKKDLLSKIALITFESGDYFFKQKELEQHISDYICNLPNAQNDQEALQLDSEAILKSIEAQHGLLVERAKGIYSFSHLTIQEYFTAKRLVDTANWQNLVSHITEERWREVFLLTVQLVHDGTKLFHLMKQKIEALVTDERLQQFLEWVSQKSLSLHNPSNLVAIRAFYFELAIHPSFGIAQEFLVEALESSCLINLHSTDTPICLVVYPDFEIIFDFVWGSAEILAVSLSSHLEPDYIYELTLDYVLYTILTIDCNYCFNVALEIASILQCGAELKKQLQQLNIQWSKFPKPLEKEDEERYELKNFINQLKDVMINYRNLGHNWQFSEQQKDLLKQYYNANKLLVECLKSNCKVSKKERSQIEETLLLPIAEIENRSHRG